MLKFIICLRRPEKYTTYLGKTFKLNDYDATMDFVKDIAKIVREENVRLVTSTALCPF
jgi:hypothetical protein